MVNKLYNKQVSPKGYFLGGRVKKKKKETEKFVQVKKRFYLVRKRKD